MIRLIIDNYGGSHHDLFLIIDSTPWLLKVVDSYYLYDFLEGNIGSPNELDSTEIKRVKYLAIGLIDYWADRIKAIENDQSKFIPFDLSDQYVAGMMLERIKRNFQLRLVWSDKIAGWNVSKANLDSMIADEKIIFQPQDENEWLISEEGIYNGLAWSRKQLES